MAEVGGVGVARAQRHVGERGALVHHVVQQAAGALPGAKAAERSPHLALEEVQETRERQVHLLGAVLRQGLAGRVAANSLQHLGDARVYRARGQRRAEHQGVEIEHGLGCALPVADDGLVAAQHMGAELVGLHRAVAFAQQLGQGGHVHALGLHMDDRDVARGVGHLVRGVGLHHGHVAGFPLAAVHAHAHRAVQAHVHADRTEIAHRRCAQQAHVEHAIGGDPHHPLVAGAAPHHQGPRSILIHTHL